MSHGIEAKRPSPPRPLILNTLTLNQARIKINNLQRSQELIGKNGSRYSRKRWLAGAVLHWRTSSLTSATPICFTPSSPYKGPRLCIAARPGCLMTPSRCSDDRGRLTHSETQATSPRCFNNSHVHPFRWLAPLNAPLKRSCSLRPRCIWFAEAPRGCDEIDDQRVSPG